MIDDAWKLFLEGDDKSFSKVYHAYYSELLAYALNLGFDDERSKDAIQDIFFNIYISRKKLNHIQNIEFYLLKSLKNRLLDIRNLELIEIGELQQDYFEENEKIVIEKIIDEEKEIQLKNKLTNLIKTLPPKQRRIIHYRYQLDLNYSEIAEIMNLSTDAVKKNLYRALKKMKGASPSNSLLYLIHLFTMLG